MNLDIKEWSDDYAAAKIIFKEGDRKSTIPSAGGRNWSTYPFAKNVPIKLKGGKQ